MYRMVSLILLCIILLAMLTACGDAMEVNDFSYAMLVGIDRGVSDKWRITFKIPSLSGNGTRNSGGGGQSEGDEEYNTLTVDAPSFFAGVEIANTNIPRRLNFMHTQFIVFSEDLAESGLAGEFITPIIRSREIRYSIRMIVTRGNAEEFVKSFEPFAGTDISRTTEDLMHQADESGLFTDLNLYDFYDCMKSTYHQPIAILGAVNNGENFIQNGRKWGTTFNIAGDYYAGDVPRKEGSKTELLGLAIFDGDRMVGMLTGHESRLLSMAKGIFQRGIFTIPDPERPELAIPIDVRPARKRELKVWFEEGKPIIHLKIQLEGDILAIQSGIHYEDPKMLPVLERALEQFIKTELDKIIKKTQELNCDVFKFGQTAVRNFGTIQEWEAYEWNKHYEEAEFTTEVKFKIRRTGTQIDNSPIIFSEEKG